MIGRRGFLGAATLGLLSRWSGEATAQDDPAPVRAAEQLNRGLAPVRDGRRLPGLIGGIIAGGRLAAVGALGLRKIGSPEPIQADDLVHLGSCTKAMTATMIGTLVDEGALTWRA